MAKKRLFVLPKYPSSVAALSFNHDGTLLVRQLGPMSFPCPLTRATQAVASSYTYEEGEKEHPPDAIFVRSVSEVEVAAKPRAPAA